MKYTDLLHGMIRKFSGRHYQVSYSQTGEDVIIELFIQARKIKNFTYLDIGANHPTKLNNTYKFYEQGFYGVCIEPDPVVYKKLSRMRPNDVCLNVGVAGKSATDIDFFKASIPYFFALELYTTRLMRHRRNAISLCKS